jgi:2,3-bisphosphoglycerate-dependent phosphoglycerate mutase
LSDQEVVGLNIPTGQPLVYGLDARMEKVDARYLDPEAAAAAAEAVKNQGR